MAVQIAQTLSFRVRFRLMKAILMSHRQPSTKAKEQASLILAETKKLQIFVMNIGHGDWFVLYQMSKNLDHKFFVDFIVRLSTKINNRRFHGKFDCAILYYFKMQRIILNLVNIYNSFFYLFRCT